MYADVARGPAGAKFRRMDRYIDLPPTTDPATGPGVRVLFAAPASASATERETLANIVKACGLTEGRDCVCAYVPDDEDLATRALNSDVRAVVAFGLPPARLGLAAEAAAYRWTATLGGRRYCFAEGLQLIGEDMARKKRLWAAIKTLKAPLPTSG